MNYKGLFHYAQLKECRVCGMDAGERMVTETLPERWFVVCRICGFKTKPHKNLTAATKEWNGGRNESI